MEFKDIKTIKDIEKYLKKNDCYKKQKDKESTEHVIVFYADGEVANTKGGPVLFERNLFTRAEPLIFEEEEYLKLPNGKGRTAFVILEDAKVPRKLLEELYLKEHPKPTEVSKKDEETIHEFIMASLEYWEKMTPIGRDMGEACYRARDERDKAQREARDYWLSLRTEGQKYDHDAYRKIDRECYVYPLPEFNMYYADMYYMITGIAARLKAVASNWLGGTSNYPMILERLDYGMPIDADLSYYVTRFLKDNELQKRWEKCATEINKLRSKYTHLAYPEEK